MLKTLSLVGILRLNKETIMQEWKINRHLTTNQIVSYTHPQYGAIFIKDTGYYAKAKYQRKYRIFSTLEGARDYCILIYVERENSR